MRKHIKTILKLCITAALLGFVLWFNDLTLVFESFTDIPLVVWIAVFVLQAACVIVSALRLSIFMRDFKFRTLLYVRVVSNAYGFVLPGQLAVEGFRAYLLGREEKEYSKPGAAIIVDKIVGILALLVLGVAGLLLSRNIGWEYAVVFSAVGIVLVMFLFSLSFSFFRDSINKLLGFLARKTGKLGKVFDFLIQVMEYWQFYIKNKRSLVLNFIYGVVYQLLCISISVLFTYGVGAGIHVADWLWIHAVISIALILPITIGGMGIREAGLVGLLGFIGIASEQALAVSFGLMTLLLVQAIVGFGIEFGVTLLRTKKEDNSL